jgi:hypothetical protein
MTTRLHAVATKRVYLGVPPRPDGRYDLVIDGRPTASGTVSGGKTMTIDMTSGSTTTDSGPTGSVRFEGLDSGFKDIEIWLPHDDTTELVALDTDAPVEPAAPTDRLTWLHHGSSISQGSNATTPTGTWPAVAARLAGVDLHNLGLGGAALLDPYLGRVLRDTPADVISVKIGINIVNTDLMRLRAFAPSIHGLLDTVREGRVEFVAASDPTGCTAGRLTLRAIRPELARIVEERRGADEHLHHLDGLRLYGEADASRLPLSDRLHPDAATHRLIGERFATLGLAAYVTSSGRHS